MPGRPPVTAKALGIERQQIMVRSPVPKSSLPKRSSIRRSTHTDLEAIRRWLHQEEESNVDGNFLCNWSTIANAHENRELLVYVDGRTGTPVAFQLGKLIRPGILQVHNAYRGRGIGRKLVDRCLTIARKNDECLLYIQCKPATSIPFWQKMGFILLETTDSKNYAYQVLEKSLSLPQQGSDVEVSISFYPESFKWDPCTQPYVTFSPRARMTADGIVHLQQRVQFHKHAYRASGDVVIGILVARECLYRDKAKYPDAQHFGVARCTNGFYLDRIHRARAGINVHR